MSSYGVECVHEAGSHSPPTLSLPPTLTLPPTLSPQVSGTSIPISVEVDESLLEMGAADLSAAITSSVQQAHAKSGAYAHQRMGDVYEELGLNKGLAGIQGQQPGQ